ncbi:MAG: hypothetical protein LBV16_02090 [Elusimicrobiota bacterium]|nr:hypothetical protein [Elusimicrobiota bacterium]
MLLSFVVLSFTVSRFGLPFVLAGGFETRAIQVFCVSYFVLIFQCVFDFNKFLDLHFAGAIHFVESLIANAKNKPYQIVRPLYYYYEVKSEKKAKPFLDYVLSAEGQKIISTIGFISLK